MGRRHQQQAYQLAVVAGDGRSLGPAMGAVFATVLVAVIAQAGRVIDGFISWYPLLLSAVGVAAVVVARRRRKIRKVIAWYSAGCWLAPGVWAVWVIEAGWSLAAVTAAIVAPTFAVLLAPALAEEPAQTAEQLAAEATQAAQADKDPFQAKLEPVLAEHVPLRKKDQALAVRKLYDWPNQTGHTWEIEGPPGSSFNWFRLRDAQVDMAAALRLPVGCPINAMPGNTHQGAAHLHISVVNDMHLITEFPADYSVRSIRDPFSIGLFLDKTQVLVELYQAVGILAGQREGGKTVLLQDMTASVLLCNDAHIMHVDLSGKLQAPWMMPYAIGEIDEPVLARIATSPATAVQLAAHLTAVAKDRNRRYQKMMFLHNTDVLPVGDGRTMCGHCHMIHPAAIIVFVDEGAEVTGETAVREARLAAELLRELQRIARAAAINVSFSVQRGTADYVPAQMKKNCSLAICLRVKDDSELAYIFDWKKGLTSADLVHNGQAYIQRNSGPVRMFKTYLIRPQQIAAIAKAVAARRPAFDDAMVSLGGAAWAHRWEHPDIVEYLAALRGEGAEPAEVVTPTAASTGFGSPGLRATAEATEIMKEAIRQQREAREAAERAAAGTPAAGAQTAPARVERNERVLNMDEAALVAELARIELAQERHERNQAAAPPQPAAVQASTPAATTTAVERYEFIVRYVREAGEAGRKTSEVIDAVMEAGLAGQRRETVKETLAAAKRRGDLFQRDDAYGQWFAKAE